LTKNRIASHLVLFRPHGIAMPKGLYIYYRCGFSFSLGTPPTFIPTDWEQKTAFWNRFSTLTEHTSATEGDINNRNETYQSTGTPIHAPNMVNFGPETAENGWRVFPHPLNFGRHCQPNYRMDVI